MAIKQFPNIIGYLKGYDRCAFDSSSSGAFLVGADKAATYEGTYGSGYLSVNFKASFSNSIYGSSINVQPKSLTSIYIIKT